MTIKRKKKQIKFCNHCKFGFKGKVDYQYTFCPYCGKKLELIIRDVEEETKNT